MVVFPASAALVTQLLKTRRQRQMRSVVPGSVEAAVDQRSRAGAFLGLLFGILVVMVLAAFAPDVHPWVICLVLLVVALLSYWIRHTIGTRPLSGAGQD